MSMPNFAVYELIQVDTGIALYYTTATEEEIIEANSNLKARDLASRFFLLGSYIMPNLHLTT